MSLSLTTMASVSVLMAMVLVASVVVFAEVHTSHKMDNRPAVNATAMELALPESLSSEMSVSSQREYATYAFPSRSDRDDLVVRHVHHHQHDHRHQGHVASDRHGDGFEGHVMGNGNDFGLTFQPDDPNAWAEELFPKLGSDNVDKESGPREVEDKSHEDIKEVIFLDGQDDSAEELQLYDVDDRLRAQILSALQSDSERAMNNNDDHDQYLTFDKMKHNEDDDWSNSDSEHSSLFNKVRRFESTADHDGVHDDDKRDQRSSIVRDRRRSHQRSRKRINKQRSTYRKNHPRRYFKEERDELKDFDSNNDTNDIALRRRKTSRSDGGQRQFRSRSKQVSHCDLSQMANIVFTASKLVPIVLASPPSQLLFLTFDSGPTYPGMHVSASFTQSLPQLNWRAESNELYTLLVVNLDFEGTQSGQFWHWGVYNIRETRLRLGTTLIRRIAPFVPLGNGDKPVRFGYFVFAQRRRRLQLESNNQPICSPRATEGRSQRTVEELMESEQLELIAATFLMVTPDEVSRRLSCRLHNCLKGDTSKENSDDNCQLQDTYNI